MKGGSKGCGLDEHFAVFAEVLEGDVGEVVVEFKARGAGSGTLWWWCCWMWELERSGSVVRGLVILYLGCSQEKLGSLPRVSGLFELHIMLVVVLVRRRRPEVEVTDPHR